MVGQATHRDLAILGVWISLIAVMAAGRVSEGDPYWQIRAGTELVNGGVLTPPDSWSWSPVPGLFHPNSPGWNIVLALSWAAGSHLGLFLLTLVSVASLLAALAALALRMGARPLPTAVVVIACSLSALPMLTARAAVPALLLLVLGLLVADGSAARANDRPWFATAAILCASGFVLAAVGNWIHTSWGALSVALALAWTVYWVFAPGVSTGLRVSASASGAIGLAAGLVAGPYSLDVIDRSTAVASMASGVLTEWTPAIEGNDGGQWLILTTGAVIVCAASAIRVFTSVPRRGRATALEASVLAVALPTAIAGLFLAIRFSTMAILLVIPALSLTLSQTAESIRGRLADVGRPLAKAAAERTRGPYWRFILAVAAVIFLPFAVVVASQLARPPAADAIAQLPTNCRLFAPATDSGPAILLRPDVKAWVDGRADYWGRDRVIESATRLRNPSPAEITPAGTTCVLLPDPAETPDYAVLTELLNRDASWRPLGPFSGYNIWVPA